MNKKILISVIVIAILIIAGLIIYVSLRNTDETPIANNDSDNVTQEQNNSIVEPQTEENETEVLVNSSGNHTVEMLDFEFSPREITIRKGDTVTWTNKGKGPHYVMTSSGKRILDSKTIHSGESWSYTFEDLGTHRYFSPIYSAMSGSVYVEE